MKVFGLVTAAASVLVAVPASSAFTVDPRTTTTTTTRTSSSSSSALNLFGSGGGDKKGPGMMDQINMFKKAQEMAKKKQQLDEELKKMDFLGTGGPDGAVQASFKYVPITNAMDPNPDYEATGFTFDDSFFDSASNDELASAIKESIIDGIKKTNEAVAAKYQTLQTDLMDALSAAKKE